MGDHGPMSLLAVAAAQHDDSFGWGPSGVVWAGLGWLALVLLTAILLRRRASRRR
ncbi:GlyGly-CTERM domain-containing protein [Jiangella sp. DSM 45060]|nr:GlyGly-CTERM domain-containing protein [Jiangella sp. DSM 45060]